MMAETEATLVKYLGFVITTAAVVVCVKLLPDEPAVLGIICSAAGLGYGSAAFNALPVVQRAKGLVSIHTPSPDDTNLMRQAVARVDSLKPAPLAEGGEP